jgi:CoA transferase family III
VLDAAQDEARTLLRALTAATGDAPRPELEPAIDARIEPRSDLASWEARLAGAGAVLAEVSASAGRAVQLDVFDVLNQRAALRGLKSRGTISAGGASRLMKARDAWIAISLGRPDDWQLAAALLGRECPDWDAVESAVAGADAEELAERAGELGLAAAVVSEGDQPSDPQWTFRRDRRHGPWVISGTSRSGNTRALHRVLDMSALWAGPLCASLLRRAGAEVVTVESASRPDGARQGDPELHRLLHEGHAFVTVDFGDPAGVEELHRLVDEADVVVSAARMRALHQLGFDPFAAVEQRPGLTWVAISAYGLTGPWSNRIGYGDDTAVAGGLVRHEPTPVFVADAVADPVTGLYAAIAGLAVSASGGGVIDAALRDAAAHVARPWDQVTR